MTTAFREDQVEERVPVRAALSLARIRTPQTTWDGETVPAGTSGTIVEILGGGREYVLDFVEPYDSVATVRADQLEDDDGR